jgi:hypothetical protein
MVALSYQASAVSVAPAGGLLRRGGGLDLSENGRTPIAVGVRPFDQKAPAPFGVPRPVGPSQPVRALHHWVVGQVPLLPLVTSNSEPGCA